MPPKPDTAAQSPLQAPKSSSPQKAQSLTWGARLRPWLIWLCRIVLGVTFVFSGWAKCIDPEGFIIKINEYLAVWGIDWLWSESVDTIAVAMAVVEFTAGVLMLTGCLKRTVTWVMAAFMLFMLPLTAYIAIAEPVADCGCFGDALIISNEATFLKNVVLTAAVVYLLLHNRKTPGIFQPLTQWIVMVASIFYCLILAFVGLTIQPLVDFRPYPIGTDLLGDGGPSLQLMYEKDGVTEAFDPDDLPDSTWTYVGRQMVGDEAVRTFAVMEDDTDVTEDVISADGAQLLLVVPDPNVHQKARASMANNLNDYIDDMGGSMIAIVGAGDVDQWIAKARPRFEVFSGDDSVLASLVRGDAGLVYLRDGRIVWKRNLYSFAADFPDFASDENVLDSIEPVDNGRYIWYITACYLTILAFTLMLGLLRPHKSRRR